MTRSEMIEKAKIIRSRDRFGTMAQEELDALPGTETLLQIPVDGGKRVPVYEIRPDTPLENPAPLLLNFHGGGFLKGRGDRDKRYCCHMAQQLGCLVWDVDYSLAPEAPFPTALNESYAVTAYAFAHAEELGIDPQRIALAGHSAGGNLVAAMLIRAYREQSFRPLAALMEYFPADQTIDPADKLSPELRQNPWWLQRAATEKEYTLYYCSPEQAEDPLVLSHAGLLPGQPGDLRREGQPPAGDGSLRPPAYEPGGSRHRLPDSRSRPRLYHQPHRGLGKSPGAPLQILPIPL